MGLLDGMFDTSQPGALSGLLGGNYSADPAKNEAAKQAVLQLGLRLMSTPGNFGQALGQSGLGAVDAYQQSLQSQRRNKFQDMQMEQMQVQAAQQRQAAARQAQIQALPARFTTPGVGSAVDATGGMETAPEAANNNAPIRPGAFDFGGYAQALAQFDPQASLAMQASMKKDTTPITLAEGALAIDPHTFKPVASNPKNPTLTDVGKLLTELNALPPNDPRRATYLDAIKKATTHQPATQVNVNTEKPLLNSIAGGLGKQIDDSLAAARSATAAIGTAQQLKSAIDSGKVISGPGATFRIAGLQIGQMLGVGGKDAAETLSNTRTAIQSMAQGELAAAQQMKGQGQITEAERDIIRRAASGDINSLTGPEIKLLAGSMEKTARFKIKQHQSNVKALEKMPNAAPLLPFYQVDEPPAYAPPGAPGVRRYNPATGALE